MRYGQTISEEGMGGKTTEAEGSAKQGKSGLLSLRAMFCDDGVMLKRVCRRTRSNRRTGRNRSC